MTTLLFKKPDLLHMQLTNQGIFRVCYRFSSQVEVYTVNSRYNETSRDRPFFRYSEIFVTANIDPKKTNERGKTNGGNFGHKNRQYIILKRFLFSTTFCEHKFPLFRLIPHYFWKNSFPKTLDFRNFQNNSKLVDRKRKFERTLFLEDSISYKTKKRTTL